MANIHLPWGSGLGRLGFSFAGSFVDFGFNSRRELTKYVAVYATFDKSHITERSWYVLTRRGWKLYRREDRWGSWNSNTNRRVPPLYDLPEAGTAQRAWELRSFFKPYQMIDWYGRQMEVISYPSPEKQRVTLMIREKDDPTTLTEVVLENYLPEVL